MSEPRSQRAPQGRAKSAVVVVDAPEADPRTRAPSSGLGEDPLSAEELLAQRFYRAPSTLEAPVRSDRSAPRARETAKPKPTHYKVVSISLYQEDIERLDAMVAELKRRGHTKANKSQLIRFALDTVDLTKLPRGY
ncbi:hypothetical protein L6R52_19725 [Myxococcota bacterium]|nr:hypothetical protein [Myxococcota bacterium]